MSAIKEEQPQPGQPAVPDFGSSIGPGHEARLRERFRWCACAAGLLVTAVGAGHLAAWLTGCMTRLGVSNYTMKANTALGLLLGGAALSLLAWGRDGSEPGWRRGCYKVLCVSLLILGFTTLAEHLTGWNLHLDELLAREDPRALGTPSPNRPGPVVAFCMVLAGVGLWLSRTPHPRSNVAAHACAVVIGVISLLGVIGHAYQVRGLYALERATAISWPTAVSQLMLSLGLLCARPSVGFMGLVTAGDLGGLMLRRLMLFSILMVPALGWVAQAGERAGIYASPMGIALLVMTLLFLFSALTFSTARSLSQSDRGLRRSQVRLDGIIGSAMDAIITVDSQQRVVLFNQAAEKMFGVAAAEAKGSHLNRFVPARFREAHAKHVQQFGQSGVSNRSMGRLGALSALRRNGEEFPIEASISQILVEGEKLYTVILRDITQRLRAEDELRQWKEELERRVHERTAELSEANRVLVCLV